MGLYQAFRHGDFPALYGPLKTAVTADVLEAGFFFAIGILAFSFLVIVPGLKGKEGIFTVLKGFIAIFVTGSIMLCNFGQEWEVAEIHTETAYKVGFRGEINASISIKIGLRSVNITLKGDPKIQELEGAEETINYNERFSWDNQGWTVGRAFFGPYAGKFNQEFRAAQYKGLPYPILWIAEYFTIDGEGIRWGRHYLQAGFYTHIMLWLAFPLWLMTMVLVKMVISYAAYFCILTGGVMIIGNLIFACVRNRNELIIPIGHEFLEPHWGWCFILCLITGIMLVILGSVVLILNVCFKEFISAFFNSQDDNDYEEYYSSREELERDGVKVSPVYPPPQANGASVHYPEEAGSSITESSEDEDDIYENPEEIARAFRRRGERGGGGGGGGGHGASPSGGVASRVKSRIQKSIKKRDNLKSGSYDNAGYEGETYENMQLKARSMAPQVTDMEQNGNNEEPPPVTPRRK